MSRFSLFIYVAIISMIFGIVFGQKSHLSEDISIDGGSRYNHPAISPGVNGEIKNYDNTYAFRAVRDLRRQKPKEKTEAEKVNEKKNLAEMANELEDIAIALGKYRSKRTV